MSNTDEPDKKPPPQPTVAWDPSEVPGLEAETDEPAVPASSGSAPTQRLPAQPSEGVDTEPPSSRVVPQQSQPAAPATTPPTTPASPPEAPAGTPPADGNATVMFTPEDVAMLEQEAAAIAQAAAEEDPLIGTLIRDKWKVLKRLGAGSFGTVYKVQDMKGGWIEALKILGVDRLTGAEAEEMRGRFLREAQIMKRLGRDSKHIVGLSTYEEDIEAGLIYFLMEFVEGGSLGDALERDGPFTVERTVKLAIQACDALMAAHEGPEPVVHRDLKLENLVLTTDRGGEEMVKVLDFGIAKIAERESDSKLTTVGTLGTPGYAAPEQLRAETVDGRTDLFAFGVILYALLTGRDPWLGHLAHESTNQIYELMVATDRAEVRPMADSGAVIPPAMVNIVMKLLRRDPAQRFQSARELRSALERVGQGGSVSAEVASLQVLTEEPGVRIEIRDGRTVVAGGPTPCTANGLAPGTYSVFLKDPRFEDGETTVTLTAGAVQDVTLVTTKRDKPAAPRAQPGTSKKKRGPARLVAALVLLAAVGGTAFAQPWGRTLDIERFWGHVGGGGISSVWVTEGGIEGGIQLIPVDALSTMLVPFYVSVPEGDLPGVVDRLRTEGVAVDASWEIGRLKTLAVEAQTRNRYFGLEGGDVRTFALRLDELEPGSQEAASLLLKVGERMAWDASVALVEGPPERAGDLVRECLELVPGHPRCTELSGSL